MEDEVEPNMGLRGSSRKEEEEQEEEEKQEPNHHFQPHPTTQPHLLLLLISFYQRFSLCKSPKSESKKNLFDIHLKPNKKEKSMQEKQPY